MKFDLRKMSLGAVAGLLVGFGVGGSVGAGAGAVVSYEAHAAGLVELKKAQDNPEVSKEMMRPYVEYAVDSFRSIDENAKKALGAKEKKP